MQQHLRDAFEQELETEPPPPPGNVIEQAMRQGTRLRRRRTVVAGAAAGSAFAILATAAVLAVPALRADDAPQAPAAAQCVAAAQDPARGHFSDSGADVAIFLRDDVTAAQLSRLEADLRADPLVRTVQYESREEAFVKFQQLWRDSPDLVEPVQPSQLPTAFRVRLRDPHAHQPFTARFTGRPGVEEVVDQAAAPCWSARPGTRG